MFYFSVVVCPEIVMGKRRGRIFGEHEAGTIKIGRIHCDVVNFKFASGQMF